MSTIIVTVSPRQLDNPTSQLVEMIPSYVSGISDEKIVKYKHEFLEDETNNMVMYFKTELPLKEAVEIIITLFKGYRMIGNNLNRCAYIYTSEKDDATLVECKLAFPQEPHKDINISLTADERKAHTTELLKARNIPHNEHLAGIETSDDVNLRNPNDVLKRALTSLIIIQLACDIANKKQTDDSLVIINNVLKTYGLENELTEKEQKVLNLEATEQEVIDMIWRYESTWPLFWALGFIPCLEFPKDICDSTALVKLFFGTDKYKSLDDILNEIKPRNKELILDEADLIFRLNWACTDARVKDAPIPAGMNNSVVVERHRGLNWLINAYDAENWDTVSAHT